MLLRELRLQNFRNYGERSFGFSPTLSLIIGPNTAGKTNLLEALYLTATGTSFRAGRDSEMIMYEQELARLQVKLKTQSEKGKTTTQKANFSQAEATVKGNLSPIAHDLSLEIVLTTGSVQGKRAPYKKYSVNGIGRKKSDFIGNFSAVLFHPQDIEMVTGSPSRRRAFLDGVLSQASKKYSRASTEYEKALRRRNKILSDAKESHSAIRMKNDNYTERLAHWDNLVIENGKIIQKNREAFLEYLNQQILIEERRMTDISDKTPGFQVEYDCNEMNRERLNKYKDKERVAGYTLVGPHRDDFAMKLKNQRSRRKARQVGGQAKVNCSRDISAYGSRGEQRMAVLWLKLGELEYLQEQTGRKPVLLLDDIFSELDHEHRRLVQAIIPKYQTIVTTADEHYVEAVTVDDEQNINVLRLDSSRG